MQWGRDLYVSTFLWYFCNYYTISIVYLFFAIAQYAQNNQILHCTLPVWVCLMIMMMMTMMNLIWCNVHNSPSEPFCQSDPLRNPSHPVQLTPNDLEYSWMRINSSFPQSIIVCSIIFIKLFVVGTFDCGHIQILLFWSSWMHDHLCISFWVLVKSVYLYLCTPLSPYPLPQPQFAHLCTLHPWAKYLCNVNAYHILETEALVTYSQQPSSQWWPHLWIWHSSPSAQSKNVHPKWNFAFTKYKYKWDCAITNLSCPITNITHLKWGFVCPLCKQGK